MWLVGYVGRLPSMHAPGAIVLALMLVCLAAGGFLAGRWARGGAREGAAVGALATLLNLLILGSLLSGNEPGRIIPSALWWLPGSIVCGIALGALGALAGARGGGDAASAQRWDATAAFTKVAACTTFLLLVIGGIVTSKDAGLAVADWPRSYGYNMFLYPLSRMTGGIYYEHAHRLFGSLVGLTTLVLAVHLHFAERRAWVKLLAAAAFVLVVVQGILGGLRVTAVNLGLALVHGVTGQIFFATMVTLAVVTSVAWKREVDPAHEPADRTDRRLALGLVALFLLQLGFGAALRHFGRALFLHAGLGVLLLPVASWIAGRSLGGARVERPRRIAAAFVLGATTTQVLLGLAALIATRLLEAGPVAGPWSIALTSTHQALGALTLASACALAAWTIRRPALGTPLGASAPAQRALRPEERAF